MLPKDEAFILWLPVPSRVPHILLHPDLRGYEAMAQSLLCGEPFEVIFPENSSVTPVL